MRDLRDATNVLAWPSLRDAHGRLLGLPFVLTACAPGFLQGWQACFVALMVASLAMFIVYMPVTVLALNGGRALSADMPTPPLTPRAYTMLLLLWTITVWGAAAVVGHTA